MNMVKPMSAGQAIAALFTLCIANPARAEDSYGGGTFMPSASFEADEHHTAGTLMGSLSFLHFAEGKAHEAGTAFDGEAALTYSSTAHEVSSDDAATDDAAPHASDVLVFDGNIHCSFGSWKKVGDKREHLGFGIQLGLEVSPTSSEPTIDRSFAGSIGFTYIAVGSGGVGDEGGFNPQASHLHLHAGIGVGYWNVPHVHVREIPCDDVEDRMCEPAFIEEPHTTDFVAVQFPVFSIERRSSDNLGLHGALELRGLPGIEDEVFDSLVSFRASGGIAPTISAAGSRLAIDLTFEITRASASVHEYPEHGPDIHLIIGPQIVL